MGWDTLRGQWCPPSKCSYVLRLLDVTEKGPMAVNCIKVLSVNLAGGQDNARSRHRVRIHPNGYLS